MTAETNLRAALRAARDFIESPCAEEMDVTLRRIDEALQAGRVWSTFEVLEACQRSLGLTKEQANRVILALRGAGRVRAVPGPQDDGPRPAA